MSKCPLYGGTASAQQGTVRCGERVLSISKTFCMGLEGDYKKYCEFYKAYEKERIKMVKEENQIQQTDAKYETAIKLNTKIRANAEVAAAALYEVCRDLKTMRDEKLYISLGYEDFGSYCEEMAGIKARWAYDHIKTLEQLGKDVLQSNASAGITKLELLTHVPALERQDFLEENSISELSVSELKKRIEELENESGRRAEQISFLKEQKEKTVTDYQKKIVALNEERDFTETQYQEKWKHADRLGAEKEELAGELQKTKAELEALKNKPVDVAVMEPTAEQIEKIKADAEADLRKQIKKEVKEAEKKAEAKYYAELSKFEDKLVAEKHSADERIKEIEKKLVSATGQADKERIEFGFYFSEVQDRLKKFIEVIDKVENPESQKKYRAAAIKFIEMILSDISDDEEPEEDEPEEDFSDIETEDDSQDEEEDTE